MNRNGELILAENVTALNAEYHAKIRIYTSGVDQWYNMRVAFDDTRILYVNWRTFPFMAGEHRIFDSWGFPHTPLPKHY